MRFHILFYLDPSNRARIRSGFLHEFEPIQGKDYRVPLRRSGNGFTSISHSYSTLESDWILGFLHRSARYATKGAFADLNVKRNVYLRDQGFVQSGKLSTILLLVWPVKRLKEMG